jgi:hypothetical protein
MAKVITFEKQYKTKVLVTFFKVMLILVVA